MGKIKNFELTPEVWRIEDEHLTPTMKLKRRKLERNIEISTKSYIDRFYKYILSIC